MDTIRDIHEGVVPYTGPWDDVHARVAGEDLTLNHMEHGILRPIWQDERIHYAVNCAAYGCPHLLATAFTADNTEALLDAGARDYVNNPRGVDIVDEDFIVISSIYDWYTEDFGDTEESVKEHPDRPRRGRSGIVPGGLRGLHRVRLRLESEPAAAMSRWNEHSVAHSASPGMQVDECQVE